MKTAKEILLVNRDERGLIVSITCKNNHAFEIYTTKSADLDEVEELHKKLSGQKNYLGGDDVNMEGMNGSGIRGKGGEVEEIKL